MFQAWCIDVAILDAMQFVHFVLNEEFTDDTDGEKKGTKVFSSRTFVSDNINCNFLDSNESVIY